ncbi:T9SS sorting signal type C domain-containing protein [Flavobacterium gelatinilyticum]|uniref:T9SS sorting signal type C domain-containing protein n=1 Tax=Flavobacterium gelatinilyticum TaxID=3003260 RepID=UPI00247FCAF3|nr:T9SS sorting signal type C domain-containing protein [Flavobacterium gelatinilyticum]
MIKNLLYAVLLFFLPFVIPVSAQQGKVDVTFNTVDDGLKGDGFDGTVRTISLQADNKLIVGGDYSSLNGIITSSLSRLNPDGTIDEGFDTGTGFTGKIYSSLIQQGGKIVLGGSFTSYKGINSGRLIRLNSDGSQDLSFNSSIGALTGIIYNMALQPDGKIIIVGSFTKYNNITVNRIARINSDGSLDNSFITGSGSPLLISDVKVLSNGKILAAGNFISFNKITANRIICLNSDGSIDNSFNTGTGFDDDVNTIALQQDGKILLGGNFTSYNGYTANRIIRLNENGSVDETFTGSGFNNGSVEIIKIGRSGNIMIGGSFTNHYNNEDVNRLVFLNTDGTVKNDFDIGSGPGSLSVLALAEDPDESWFIGGSFSVFDGQNQGRLAKISFEGELDSSYLSSGIGFDNSVLKMISLEDNKTIVTGSFTKFNNQPVFRITRLLEDGSNDQEFNKGQSGANNLIKTAVLQTDGKIVLGGNFSKYNEVNCTRIARIFSDGTLDSTYNTGSGFNGQVYAMAIQEDNKIIVGGSFTRYNNDPSAIRIVRLLPDGSRDISFKTGLGADAVIEEILIQPDGKILVGGRFTTFNGESSPHLVRLNNDGSIDKSFNIGSGFDKYVYAIALQSDHKIIVGGSFLSYNGISQKRILRLNPDGILDTTFNSETGFNKGDVRAILVQPDDRIIVGGTFSGTYKNNASLRLIRLLKSGDFDSSFEARLNNKLFALSFTSNFRLLIGGNFNSVSGISKHRISRLKLCLDSTIWDGNDWSNGYPSGGKEVLFKEDFSNLISSNVCSCNIEKGKTVSLLKGSTLGIEFDYSGSGTLVLEDTASLYQSDDDIVNTGTIHLKRKTNPILRYDFTFWSSPVGSHSLKDVSPTTLSDKYYSYIPGSGWKIESPSTTMILGKGYMIRAPQEYSITSRDTYEAVFKGIPNNGKIEITLGDPRTFSLIGNPYPSAIDADVFLEENKSKTAGALYFWTHNTAVTNLKYNSDDYAAYNLVGGIGVQAKSSGVNELVPNGKIAAGQSFFLKSTVSGNLEFNNSMRIKGNNNFFFKHNEIISTDKPKKHRFWLNFSNDEGAFKQILIGYLDGASNSFDSKYDAESFNGNSFVDFYSVVDTKKLVIQGRALPIEDSDEIVLGYKTTAAGNFIISIDHADGDFTNKKIYLEDKSLNTIFDLTSKNYLFESEAGSFADRFAIRFFDTTLSIPEHDCADNLIVSVNNKIIKINSLQEELKNVFVYDIGGKLLYEKLKVDTTELEIKNLNRSTQVLVVKIELRKGKFYSKKIIF